MRRNAKFGLYCLRDGKSGFWSYAVVTQFTTIRTETTDKVAVMFHEYQGDRHNQFCMVERSFLAHYKFVTKHIISQHTVTELAYVGNKIVNSK